MTTHWADEREHQPGPQLRRGDDCDVRRDAARPAGARRRADRGCREGSLWPRELIEKSRAPQPELRDGSWSGVDPPAGVGRGVATRAGSSSRDRRGRLYVLADETLPGIVRKDGRAASRRRRRGGTRDMVVAEANNGGAMVGSVLKAADVGAEGAAGPCVAREGGEGGADRASRFESGQGVLWRGTFRSWRTSLAGWMRAAITRGPGRSPDRADAMVWAMTEMGESWSGIPRVRML